MKFKIRNAKCKGLNATNADQGPAADQGPSAKDDQGPAADQEPRTKDQEPRIKHEPWDR